MRLFLLGCTGFIGSELVPKLLASGNDLTIITRKELPRWCDPFDKKQILHIQTDPSNPESWKEKKLINALKNAEGVINLAGEPIAEKRWTTAHCKKLEQSRCGTTQYLVEAMSNLKKAPKFLLNASAIGYYGTSQNESFTEDSGSGDDFLAKLCQKWETLAKEKPRSTRLVLLRIGIVLEANGGALSKMLPVFRAGFGGPIGNGKQWMSWIHRSDLCQIIEKSISYTKWEGVINAVAPHPVLMSYFSDTLGRTLGRPSLLPVPGPLLKLLLGDGAKVVLEGQKVISKQLNTFKFEYPDLEKSLEAITSRD